MTRDNKDKNAREEMARGDEALRAAEELLRLGLHNDAISRAYYAAYHWARALLFTEGVESRTHRGVIQLVGLRFVREGRLPDAAVRALAQLEDTREASDYSASVRFAASEAREAIGRAKAFIALCRPLLETSANGC
jgi:uncharacterized protein (UPF0332 family)